MSAVDLLASNYGWDLDDIYNRVYFDELFFLTKKINERRIREYRMILAIVQNPHVKDPKKLWNLLSLESDNKRIEKFDAAGFENFKTAISKNPRFIVK